MPPATNHEGARAGARVERVKAGAAMAISLPASICTPYTPLAIRCLEAALDLAARVPPPHVDLVAGRQHRRRPQVDLCMRTRIMRIMAEARRQLGWWTTIAVRLSCITYDPVASGARLARVHGKQTPAALRGVGERRPRRYRVSTTT